MILLPFKSCDVKGQYGTCPECDFERIRTRSGAVCPNGHGAIATRGAPCKPTMCLWTDYSRPINSRQAKHLPFSTTEMLGFR